jgi:hypothetical protein
VSRGGPDQADVAEAWTEVARLRRRALEAWREAAERRRVVVGARDPFHPRAQGLAAAAEFHEARAARASERARGAARVAADLESRLVMARRAARCA